MPLAKLAVLSTIFYHRPQVTQNSYLAAIRRHVYLYTWNCINMTKKYLSAPWSALWD